MRRRTRLSVLAATTSGVVAVALTAMTGPASATTGTAFGSGGPGFVDSAAPASDGSTFFQSDSAGEPSLGIDWKTGNTGMFMAGTDTYQVHFNNATSGSQISWTDVSSPYSLVNLDPILATSHTTGTTLAGGDDGACAVMSRTTNDGGSTAFDTSSWTPTVPCPFTADHPTVGIGPASSAIPDPLGSEVAYFCQQTDLDFCSHSFDGGQTWIPSGTDPSLTCVSLFGHVKIAPDGTAYVPDANCIDPAGNSVIGAFLTKNNGVTWSGYGIPGASTPPDGFDPSIGIDNSGRVYESWSAKTANGDYHPMITWSDNQGATWAPPVDLTYTIPGGVGAATFEAVVAGDGGGSSSRAAVAYLASQDPTGGKDPFSTGYVGHWNLYVSYTYDGGHTWQTVQANPVGDYVQIGEIDAGGTTTSGQRNLLDFMDASMTSDGRVVVAYADGCLNGCSTVAQSQDAKASVAYQSVGNGLLKQFDTAPPPAGQ